MLLSHNIALEELSIGFLGKAFPQLKAAFAFRWLHNGAVSSYTNQDEFSSNRLKELANFVQESNSGWYAREETPIELKKAMGQIKLEDEMEKNFLLLRSIEAEDVQLSFLLEFGTFGLSTTNYLSGTEKKLIETTIKNFMREFVKIQLSDKSILKKLAENNNHLHKELQSLNQRLENRNEHFERTLNQLMQLLLNKLQQEINIKIQYQPSFSKALLAYRGSFEDLEHHLTEQLLVDANLALLQGDEEIWLDESHLSGIASNKLRSLDSNKAEPKIKLGRLAKSYALLDRYETSAEKLVANSMSIIGKNIGLYCSPPISNAAITDALSKNAKKIFELFEKYPDKWPIIRSDFKSIANIIEKESIRRQTA